MQSAVIFDMDGTLADVSAMRHHVLGRHKNFEAFHSESVDAPPNEWVVSFARGAHEMGMAVIIVTARKAKWRHHTAMWLALHGVPSDAMFMRGDKDSRKDFLIKRDILAAIRHTWVPVLAVDDNPAVLELWEGEGINTIRVEGWVE